MFQMGDVETVNHIPEVKCIISDCGQLHSINSDFFDPDDGLPHGPDDLTIIPKLIKVDNLNLI